MGTVMTFEESSKSGWYKHTGRQPLFLVAAVVHRMCSTAMSQQFKSTASLATSKSTGDETPGITEFRIFTGGSDFGLGCCRVLPSCGIGITANQLEDSAGWHPADHRQSDYLNNFFRPACRYPPATRTRIEGLWR